MQMIALILKDRVRECRLDWLVRIFQIKFLFSFWILFE